MSSVSRRGLLTAAGAAAAGVSLGPVTAPPAAADPAPTADLTALRVLPGDGRYDSLRRGFNQRWSSNPRYVQLIADEADAVAAVQHALSQGLRPTVRSGGHCYEDFVDNTGGAILDVSPMRNVYRTRDKRGRTAYCVESGASNWDVYSTLFRKYGVTLPAGSCNSVGAGGHICGGGYGLLSRRHGLTVDHLVQVDVVTVRNGRAELTAAHRDDRPGSDTAELFWAHTGGGGGNFGLVVRYYFAETLPKTPEHVWISTLAWPWAGLEQDRDGFERLLRNYGEFFAAHSAPEEPLYQGLFSMLQLSHRSNGSIVLLTQWDQDDPGPLDSFLAALQAGVKTRTALQSRRVGEYFLPSTETRRQLPWFQAASVLSASGDLQRGKYKSAYHRSPLTDGQIAGIWNALTRTAPGADLTQTLVQVDSYGCRINAVGPAETAVPQRDSILKLQYQTYWTDPAEDAAHLDFLREFYAGVYADTGGLPEVSSATRDLTTDGAYVNYPDTDLGVATDPSPRYPQLYYKDNYPRLQAAKALWDPQNRFHHAQSIVAPPGSR
ncbi:FAD-binding oxidoreductase [Kitasatospora mediocidica]|uniref:FAD-binding oxidoreductase n=1 Tax=Kitasatospora mediocidica TaxID=58352 RepID=UPI0005605D0C|nr:BBE domain-containing protein [Kitasatospora mediocidica]